VVDQGVIFLGDIVLNKRIAVDVPEQGNTSGQTAAIEVALKSKASHFIPGHGSSGGREIALAQRAFLIALRTAVKNYYDQGLSDIAMNDKLKNELAGYKEWVGFDRLARLVNATYRQVETELF
jgi:glyoxylase-like metal-dependent hydrolase (beta-lactamase superfamily II)